MKKLFLTMLVATAISCSAFAGTEKVNFAVLNSFSNQFENAANVNWKLEKEFVKASFIIDNIATEAFYTYEGELIGTSKAFAYDKLSKKAIATISSKYPYPPYKLQECIEFVTSNGETSYYVSLETNKQKVVLKVLPGGSVSEFKKTNK